MIKERIATIRRQRRSNTFQRQKCFHTKNISYKLVSSQQAQLTITAHTNGRLFNTIQQILVRHIYAKCRGTVVQTCLVRVSSPVKTRKYYTNKHWRKTENFLMRFCVKFCRRRYEKLSNRKISQKSIFRYQTELLEMTGR